MEKPERQEPVDDGDDRVRQLFRIEGRTAPPRPRRKEALNWGPWLRWTIINGPIWALLGAAVALCWMRREAEKAMTPPHARVYPPEPARKD